MSSNLPKALYDRTPPALQSLMLSAYSLHLDRHRYGKGYRDWVRRLTDSEHLDAASLESLQNQMLPEVIRHAANHVPYYRAQFSEYGINVSQIQTVADLPKLPILTREDIAENFHALTSERASRRRLTIGHTSGTTGSPLEVLHDPAVTYITYALLERQYRWAGLRLGRGGDRVAVLRGNVIVPIDTHSPPYWRHNLVHNQLVMSAFHLSTENLDGYVNAIRSFGAQALDGYPSTLYVVARHLLRTSQSLPLRAAITSSETLYPFQREAIEEAFECRVFDYFAAAERVVFATECDAHEGHHVASEYGVLELVDQDGRQVAEGMPGIMVGTSLHNLGMPLLRYRCNDVTALRNQLCSCGRALPLMEDVSTKAEDILALPDGRLISPSVLTHPFKPMHSVEESQIVQDRPDSIRIKIKPNAAFTPAESEYLVREFRKRLGENIEVSVEVVDDIPRTSAGKFKWVVSEVRDAIRVP